MLRNLFTKKRVESDCTFSPKVVLLTPVQVSKNGRVCKSNEFKPFDIADSLKDFTINDFSISNLESIGAFSKLKTTFMGTMSDMRVADSFENLNIVQDV